MSLYFSLRSSKNIGQKVGKWPLFLLFCGLCFVHFQAYNLHFAPFCLSIWPPTHNFLAPQFSLFTPKIPLFYGYFAPFSHVFHGSKRFCLCNWCGCLCFLFRIQLHFALRLAPKYTAFSTKTHCIQHQNALHLAPKRTAFSTKMQCIQRQNAQKQVQMAVCLNKYSFCQHSHATPFCIKTNLRENRFFATRWAVGG